MTVINTYMEQIQVGTKWGVSPQAVIGAILMIGFASCAFAMVAIYINKHGFSKEDRVPLIAFIIFGCLLVVFSIRGFSTIPVYIEEPRYEVIVDDTVSFNWFTNNYEILDQRGDIYTIKVRNN